MDKDKEVEVVDSREEEVDPMEKVVDLKKLCKIRENLNGRMMTKTRPSGKEGAHTKEVLDLTEEEVILVLEVVSIAIILDVVNKSVGLLNVDFPKVGIIIEIL